jgi:hypothetical protein
MVDISRADSAISRSSFIGRSCYENLLLNNCTFCRDDLVIKAGSEAGAMLVDGLGDGVMLEAADQDFDFLRNTSFGMLQGCRMRNTKTVRLCREEKNSSVILRLCSS